MDNCIFCKIINKEIPSYKIYEDEKTYAFLDISKDAEGHTLVIPKCHYSNIFDTDQETLASTIKTTQKICNHYKSLGFDGINILNNNGQSAEQTINHLHIHIIPRKANDNLKIFPNLKEQDLDLSSIQEKLAIKTEQ